jgi:hypothetical protein
VRNSSPLLINESPLQVLPSLATAIGLNEAIVLQQVHYWLTRSTNIRDGRAWVYKTYPEWKEEFPFWSEDTIGRTVRKLETSGILLSTDKYNQIATDRTKWYSIDYDKLDSTELPSRSPQVATVEDGNLQSSRAPQVATILPETTQRLPTETPESAISKPEVGWIFADYLSMFNEAVSPGEHDDLAEIAKVYPSRDDIREAMQLTKSADARKRISRKVAYMRGILQDWAKNGKPEIRPKPEDKPSTPIKPKKVYR